jgi:colicin import membrane protein
VSELIKSSELEGVEITKAQQIKAVFEPMSQLLMQFDERYNNVISESEKGITEDVTKKAKRLRLDIGKVRIETEKTRKAQKEEYLRAGKAIDGVANILKFAVVDKEEKLESIEKHFENIEKERLEKLEHDRRQMLADYCDVLPGGLSSMPDDVFNAYLSAKKKEYEDRIEAEKQAEIARLESGRLDKIENERYIKILPLKQFWTCDNYSLRIMSEPNFETLYTDLETAKQEYDREQEAIAKENSRLKAEAERKEAERIKAEKERAEKERIERRMHEIELEKERKERAKIEREEREKREAIERELAEKKEAEKRAKAEEEARIQEKLTQGDAETIKDLKCALATIKTAFNFKSENNKAMMKDVCVLIDKTISFVDSKK